MASRKKPQGVRFARVPSGNETCQFCYMLAARGAVYYTAQTAGENAHWHKGCRCKIVPAWGTSSIEGYDPALYSDIWRHPEKYPELIRQRAAGKDKEGEAAKIAAEYVPIVRVPLDTANFPDVFTGKKANAEKTQAFVDTVNAADVADPKMLALYNKIGELAAGQSLPIEVHYGKGGEVGYTYYSYRGLKIGDPHSVYIKIPPMKGDNLTGQANTTAHEMGHLIDYIVASSYQLLPSATVLHDIVAATRATKDGISEKAKELFAVMKAKKEDIERPLKEAYKKAKSELLQKYIDKHVALVQDKNDLRQMRLAYFFAEKDSEYEKELKKLAKEYAKEVDYFNRNAFGCIGSLEDIYDALSGGSFRDGQVVSYGHGRSYYAHEGMKEAEIWANFCAISLFQPELLDYIREDFPGLVEELERMRDEILGA